MYRSRNIACTTPVALAFIVALTFLQPASAADGDPERGQRVFQTCAACHSLEPDRNMTGPSLAGIWDRQAGGLASFKRYSPALKSSGVVWNENSLNEWIKDPQHFIPGNTMTFPGIKEPRQRADLLAFLKDTGAQIRLGQSQRDRMGGMAGTTGGSQFPKLGKLDPEERVKAIRHCDDTYKVTTADGKTRDFWERNLRFKTDSSEEGPRKNEPAIVGAGMAGDRASVIFATPSEISAMIVQGC